MIIAQFAKDQQFCDVYKRNNKGKGRKNMRCFPACCANGHVDKGYCGRPVTVNTACDCDAAKGLDLLAFCEIRQHYDTSAPLDRVSLRKKFTVAEIMERSRDPNHNPGKPLLRPWFPGVVLSSSTDKATNQVHKTFSFNYRNQGWHYAWQAQSRQNVKHELTVFILAGSKDREYFTCVSEVSSPPFSINCRRKTQMIEAAAKAVHGPTVEKLIKPVVTHVIKPGIQISVRELMATRPSSEISDVPLPKLALIAHDLSARPSSEISAVPWPGDPLPVPVPADVELRTTPLVTKRELGVILLKHIMPSNAPGLAAFPGVPSRALKVVKTEGKAFCATSSKALVSCDRVTHFDLRRLPLASVPSELKAVDHMWMDLLLKEFEAEQEGGGHGHCDVSSSGGQASSARPNVDEGEGLQLLANALDEGESNRSLV
jgi:hypothetical protein